MIQGLLEVHGIGVVTSWGDKDWGDGNVVTYVELDIPRKKDDGTYYNQRHTVELRGRARNVVEQLKEGVVVDFSGYLKARAYLRKADGEPACNVTTVGLVRIVDDLEFGG